MITHKHEWKQHNNGLVQNCSNSIANALELPQSCVKPSIFFSEKLHKLSWLHWYFTSNNQIFFIFLLLMVWSSVKQTLHDRYQHYSATHINDDDLNTLGRHHWTRITQFCSRHCKVDSGPFQCKDPGANQYLTRYLIEISHKVLKPRMVFVGCSNHYGIWHATWQQFANVSAKYQSNMITQTSFSQCWDLMRCYDEMSHKWMTPGALLPTEVS